MQEDSRKYNCVMTLIAPGSHNMHKIQTTSKNDTDINKQQTHSSACIPTVDSPQHNTYTSTTSFSLLHIFNMCVLCLSAINGKPCLSVIMTGLYGRPCFSVPWTGLFWDGYAINKTPLLKLLPFAPPQTLQVPFFFPKSQPHFPHLPQDHAQILYIAKILYTF